MGATNVAKDAEQQQKQELEMYPSSCLLRSDSEDMWHNDHPDDIRVSVDTSIGVLTFYSLHVAGLILYKCQCTRVMFY